MQHQWRHLNGRLTRPLGNRRWRRLDQLQHRSAAATPTLTSHRAYIIKLQVMDAPQVDPQVADGAEDGAAEPALGPALVVQPVVVERRAVFVAPVANVTLVRLWWGERTVTATISWKRRGHEFLHITSTQYVLQ